MELLIHHLYLALCASKDLTVDACDACDNYTYAPVSVTMTHFTIDDAYFEWYKEKTTISLNQRHVLPVLYSL